VITIFCIIVFDPDYIFEPQVRMIKPMSGGGVRI